MIQRIDRKAPTERGADAMRPGGRQQQRLPTGRRLGQPFDMPIEAKGIAARPSPPPFIRAGSFQGPMVISLKPISAVIAVTDRYPIAPDGPVQVGDPAAIGADPRRAA